MARILGGFVLLLYSACAFAQSVPGVDQWIRVIEVVRQHALFKDLNMAYAKAPAANIGYTPVGVLERAGVDCVVVVSDGENPKMAQMMAFPSTPLVTAAFMETVAAHELGHCIRMRGKQLSLQLWERVAAAAEGSAERLALEKQLSMEEAYADAYAFVYLKDTHPALYEEVLLVMESLRNEPNFANPFYQVDPLYAQLKTGGFDARLPLRDQVAAVMLAAKF